jgi:hypothetical protein
MPTFNPNQRTVEVPVPANELPTVVQKQPQQQPAQPKPETKQRTIVLPFIHPVEEQ